jgi:hypothetical protein
MSRSPRKSIRQAAHALDQLFDVLAAHPTVREEIVESLGEDGLRELEGIRGQIRGFIARLEAAGASGRPQRDRNGPPD